jgi:hypothetical protein
MLGFLRVPIMEVNHSYIVRPPTAVRMLDFCDDYSMEIDDEPNSSNGADFSKLPNKSGILYRWLEPCAAIILFVREINAIIVREVEFHADVWPRPWIASRKVSLRSKVEVLPSHRVAKL